MVCTFYALMVQADVEDFVQITLHNFGVCTNARTGNKKRRSLPLQVLKQACQIPKTHWPQDQLFILRPPSQHYIHYRSRKPLIVVLYTMLNNPNIPQSILSSSPFKAIHPAHDIKVLDPRAYHLDGNLLAGIRDPYLMPQSRLRIPKHSAFLSASGRRIRICGTLFQDSGPAEEITIAIR